MEAILAVHIGGGALGLIAGAAAFASRKGARWHRRSGQAFVIGMAAMAVMGGIVALQVEKPFDALSSGMTIYLILSGLLTYRATTPLNTWPVSIIGGVCTAGYLSVEIYAHFTGIRATDAPPGVGYVFASILALALYGDWRRSLQPYDRTRQMVRHLWRMSFGLFIATASFFGARPHLFPDWMQSSGALVGLTLAPLLLMGFWWIKVRFFDRPGARS